MSAFVVCTFTAYAIRERSQESDTAAVTSTAAQNTTDSAVNASLKTNQSDGLGNQSPSDSVQPQAASSSYRDGNYTGDVADAYFGQVDVQAVIQGGKITNVQFLDYPHDRRTSVRINSIAIPYLQSEAIQAQNAQVDIISGATLTSEAFIQSLQSALDKARG